MKRVIVSILFIVLILCSCSNGVVKSDVLLNEDSLNTAFSLKTKGVIYSGEIKVNNNDEIELMFNKPETISGISFIITENSIKGMSGDVSVFSSDVITDTVFSELFNAVKILRTAEEIYKSSDGLYEYKHELFKVELDSEGKIITLTTKNGEFYFNN